jgi:hypothetical protein
MKRQNPPQSSLERADAIEKYLSPVSIASMYGVLGIFYIAIVSLLFADLVANSDVSVSATSVTIYVAFAIIPASFLMLAWILRPEDPLSRHFFHLASRWRQPIALPPDCCTFQALMMDGEPISIKLSFYYPGGDQTALTKERLYTYVQAALASDCCMRYKMPTRRQLELVIDKPLETLAEELKIPILYCEIEDIYSMREGDIHAALAIESSHIHLSRLAEFGYDFYPQPEECAMSAYEDIFRIRQIDVEETLASNYGKPVDIRARVDVALSEPREPISINRDRLPITENNARIPRILEVEQIPQSQPVEALPMVEAASAEEVIVHSDLPLLQHREAGEREVEVGEPMEAVLAALEAEQERGIEIHEMLEAPVAALKPEVATVDHKVTDEPVEAASVGNIREEDVHAALTNVCMLLSELPSLHDLDVVVDELPESFADEATAALYSKFKAAYKIPIASFEDTAESERDDDLAEVNALRGIKKIGPGYVRQGDRNWLRTGT